MGLRKSGYATLVKSVRNFYGINALLMDSNTNMLDEDRRGMEENFEKDQLRAQKACIKIQFHKV